LELLWSMNLGRSFRAVVISLINFGVILYSAKGVFGNFPQGYTYGLLIGLLLLIGLFMGASAAAYSSSSNMIRNLDIHLNGGYFMQPTDYCDQVNSDQRSCETHDNCVWNSVGGQTPKCVRGMVVNLEVRDRFLVVAIFSAVLGFFEIVTALLLYRSKDTLQQSQSSYNEGTSNSQYKSFPEK